MKCTKTLKERILEAYQHMDWREVERIERTNNISVSYPVKVEEARRPVQSEGVYLHEGGITDVGGASESYK
jgi:hypothetical protein